MSFGDWLRRHRQSRRAIEAIWELIMRPTLNLTVDDASLAQAAQVFQVGLLSDASAGDIGWAVAPLGEIHDRAARAALERAGVSVQWAAPRRRCHGSRCRRARQGRLSFQVDASDGFSGVADAVVVALPPAQAARLLPANIGVAPDFARTAWGFSDHQPSRRL